MRAYKFLDARFGLKSLYERRLKIARINELNDPFELTPYDLSDSRSRWAFHSMRREFGLKNGLVCFSADWGNPVIWAHYSDKHRGICLGFEIPTDRARRVEYIKTPKPFPSDFLRLPFEQQFAIAEGLAFTKYSNWEYEHEIRTWVRDLEGEEGGLYYKDFDEALSLVEVILGAGCSVSRKTIGRALGDDLANGVTVKKARAAYNVFEMVEDTGS